jgi:hypothetical protein
VLNLVEEPLVVLVHRRAEQLGALNLYALLAELILERDPLWLAVD